MEKEPQPPRTLNPQVDRDLEALCLKCLKKDPRQRYGSAAELADDLERWQRGEPTRARPPSAWQAARYWLRQNLRAALWVVAGGLVLGVVMGVSRLIHRVSEQGLRCSTCSMLPSGWFHADRQGFSAGLPTHEIGEAEGIHDHPAALPV
jgi:hypothetical protein